MIHQYTSMLRVASTARNSHLSLTALTVKRLAHVNIGRYIFFLWYIHSKIPSPNVFCTWSGISTLYRIHVYLSTFDNTCANHPTTSHTHKQTRYNCSVCQEGHTDWHQLHLTFVVGVAGSSSCSLPGVGRGCGWWVWPVGVVGSPIGSRFRSMPNMRDPS